MAATRPHPEPDQIGEPRPAKPCQCAEPAGDPRDSLCIYCGRQVNGKPLGGGFTAFPYHQGPQPARKRPRYRSAP